MKKVLLTGGAGFGGSGLAKELLKAGYQVKIIDIIGPNHVDNLRQEIDKGKIEYVWKSVHDISGDDMKGIDILCHFAAQADVPMGFPSPIWTTWENVLGTVTVLEAARQAHLEKLIIPSSGNVMGRPLYSPIDEKHPLTPHNPYAASKACQELFAQSYQRCYGIPIVIFRNGIVYGPGMRRDIFIFIWLKNIILGKPIVIEGGDQTRDPCFVTDTVQAWLAAIKAEPKDVCGQIFQVSRGDEYSIKTIAEKVILTAKEFGLKKPKIIYTKYRPGEKGQKECFDITKARKILGYHPKIDLDRGLKLTLKWMLKESNMPHRPSL